MDLFTVRLNDSDLDKLGQLGYKTKRKLQPIVENLAFSARDAFKSKVPIDTGELRSDIEIKHNGPKEFIVYAEGLHSPTEHFGRRSTGAETIAKVIADLQAGTWTSKNGKTKVLHRSQTSEKISPYSSIGQGAETAGWLDDAKAAYWSTYKTTIRRLLSNG